MIIGQHSKGTPRARPVSRTHVNRAANTPVAMKVASTVPLLQAECDTQAAQFSVPPSKNANEPQIFPFDNADCSEVLQGDLFPEYAVLPTSAGNRRSRSVAT